MVDECGEAGHRGYYKSDHVFHEAAYGGLVSAEYRGILGEIGGVAYLSSDKIMMIMVWLGFLASGIW